MNKNKNRTRLDVSKLSMMAAGLALAMGLTACQNAPRNENSPELQALSAKLDAISRKIDAMAGQARAPAKPKRPTVGQLYKVPVGEDEAYRGGEHAKVTLVLASEFACPYCAQLAAETDALLEAFADDELKLVSKHFIVHPSIATKPAQAVCAAAKQGHFEEYEGALWQKAWRSDESKRLNRDALAPQGLDAIAKGLDMDLARFHADMEGSCSKTVAQNHRQMVALGVNGTPAVYLNGVYYGGARSFDALKAAIDAEIAKVDASLAKGVPLEGHYDRLIAKGKTSI